jgi:hypothetical protein
MGNITMPEVEQATHLGIIKTTTMKHNIQTVMTGFVSVSFSGRVLVVQEVLRTVIIAPYRKAILVLCRFC